MKTNSIPAGLAGHARTITTTRQLSFRRACLWTGFLAFATIAFGPPPAQAAVTEAWVQRYGSETESRDSAYKVVTDAAGNVIVIGFTGNQTGLIIKYSGAGVPLWTNRYDPARHPFGALLVGGVAVDGSGNVFVTGKSAGSGGHDYATIAYSGAGVPLWTNHYSGPGNSYDRADAVAVDGSGNVFVTGLSLGSGGADYATIAYSGAGVPLWTNRCHGTAGSDGANAVAVDASGNVFVTGYSYGSGGNYDYATIAYSGAGLPLWTNHYNGPGNSYDRANAVAVDGSGNVFVTGISAGSGDNWDYATIAYSGAGVPLWTNRHNGSANGDDVATGVAVDGSGNVFVTGESYSFSSGGGSADYATIAYSGAGVPLWTNRYDNNYDQATAVAVDGSGNVFVTGSSATIAYSGAGVPLWTNGGSGTAIAMDASGNLFVTGYSFATIAYSGTGVPLWTNSYVGREEASDIANAVAVDAGGNVFVTGTSATIAYSGAGAPLWTNSGSGTAIALDGSGNVFVTGYSAASGGSYGYATIAYSGAGVPLWTNRYDGPENRDDVATALAVDGSGNVFVTGYSAASGGSYGYATIAYSGAGVPLWTNRYKGTGNGSDAARAVAVDASGNVFVTGSSYVRTNNPDYATIAYSGAGVPLWTNRYKGTGNGWNTAIAVAVGGSGNVFVTGSSEGIASYSDYATIAYSGAGVALWTNRYNGPANHTDFASAVAVDASGKVFVTGYSYGSGGDHDYATIAYSSAGVPLWTKRYNGTGNGWDIANAVAVDASGNVFVTGYSADSGGNDDYVTIAYSGAGVPLWTNRYNGPGNRTDGPQTKSSLAIGSDGAVYVTGASDGLFSSDFATVKYVWRTEIAIQLLSTIPPKVNLTLSGAPNSSWAIERALELTGPWTNLSALLIGTNGSAQFQDTNSPHPAGFYRARQ